MGCAVIFSAQSNRDLGAIVAFMAGFGAQRVSSRPSPAKRTCRAKAGRSRLPGLQAAGWGVGVLEQVRRALCDEFKHFVGHGDAAQLAAEKPEIEVPILDN